MILAGGEGRRVGGRDKGLLHLAGRPLIAHVIAALRQQVETSVICANRNANEYAQFAPVIADAAPGFRGPLAGIAKALQTCSTPWLLTVPVDCPQPPVDLARRLLAADARAAVAHDGRGRQPLFALYRCDDVIAATVERDLDSGVWQWQDKLGAVNIDFSDLAGAFHNLNTQAEFRLWERNHDE
ncbi:MAG: molybdenum cofactor guanylyltransferase MobA [Rudaea sp.]